ncbi:MAG: DsbC family protein [Candidatus Methylomirabilota bacterium]
MKETDPCSRVWVSGLAMVGFVGSLVAAPRVAPAASLQETAQRLFPQSKVEAVEPTPIPNLYEVRAGKSVVYMEASGRYVLVGELYDFATRKNLTAQRLLALNTVKFEDLPFAQAIHLGPAKPTRRIAVFEDVDCSFCKKLHTDTLPALLKDGVGVEVFLLPLPQLHPQAELKSKRVWCSPDPAAALLAVMEGQTLDGVDPGCRTPLADIKVLADRLEIHGTPTLVLDTGARLDGYLTYDALMARWQAPTRK